jgi:hypothetical protein
LHAKDCELVAAGAELVVLLEDERRDEDELDNEEELESTEIDRDEEIEIVELDDVKSVEDEETALLDDELRVEELRVEELELPPDAEGVAVIVDAGWVVVTCCVDTTVL